MQNDRHTTPLYNSSAVGSFEYDVAPEDQQTGEEDFHDESQSGVSQTDQPSLEQIQNLYYTKGLEELESLQLLDLSPLATWKLSSCKQGYGLDQLRDDTPSTYWQSDGSTENTIEQQANTENAQLNHPHTVTLQFSKKVSLERISIFTNYQLDESYTPLRIKIMAGNSNWDLTEVCVVTFDKPIGWSHIIFKGVRADGLLKCFVVKIVVLANHQDGKDSHIRAIRCFGKKAGTSFIEAVEELALKESTLGGFVNNSINGMSGISGISGILLNHVNQLPSDDQFDEEHGEIDPVTTRFLSNVTENIGFNTGFDSLELRSISSIR